MRVLVIAAALVALGTSCAFAEVACWYNAQRQYTGADVYHGRYRVGMVTNNGDGDKKWLVVVEDFPCPAKAPLSPRR